MSIINLIEIYESLLTHFGKRYWWPAETRFEVIVGAILTQNTAWKNVEKAILNLKKNKSLNCKKIANIDIEKLEKLIQPSGFYKQKAERLKKLCIYLEKNYNSNLNTFFNRNTNIIRKELLTLSGIGNETADSILLYAGDKKKFVIDAYTMRVCRRAGIFNGKDYTSELPSTNPRIHIHSVHEYDEYQKFFEFHLPKNLELYKEFHALIVELGKNHCRKKPRCDGCPLTAMCKIKII